MNVARGSTITTWWAGEADLARAWDMVAACIPGHLVSGDVAADAIAPTRRPRQLVIHAPEGSLSTSELIPVLSPTDATVVLHVHGDPVAQRAVVAAMWRGRSMCAADDLQIAWDLKSGIGEDATVAQAAWYRRVIGRWR